MSSSEVDRGDGAGARGMEIFEVHPVILGGSPTDPKNKVLLTRERHIQAVRYWNKVVSDLRARSKN